MFYRLRWFFIAAACSAAGIVGWHGFLEFADFDPFYSVLMILSVIVAGVILAVVLDHAPREPMYERRKNTTTSLFLRQLANARRDNDPPPTLLSYRPQFREILAIAPLRSLRDCFDSTNPEIQRLAIWLFGRCATPHVSSHVALFRHAQDVRLRREVARALQRLEAWSELRQMEGDPDSQVRRLAVARGPSDYDRRLAGFLQRDIESLDVATEVAPPRKTLWTVDPLGPGRPAKNSSLIRRILLHIQAVLRAREASPTGWRRWLPKW